MITIKKHLIISFNNKSTDILVISKYQKQYCVNYHLNYKTGTDNISDKNIYIDGITKLIRESIDMKFKNIYFHIQNDEIIIRNMDSISIKKKKDIIPLIKYEINKYMPIDLQNYMINYKKIIDFQGKELIQGVLFPRKFVDICKEISEKIKVKKTYLHINFDILQKIIDMNLFEVCNSNNDKAIIIENRSEDMILNKVFNNKIIESYTVNKNDKMNFINTFTNNIYYFGIDDDYIKSLDIKKIELKNKLILNKEKDKLDVTLDYLCVWGMIV